MTFSFTTRLGLNTYSIFSRFYTPCSSTSYTPTWKNAPSAWTGSITWATSLINMVYMWIQVICDWPAPTTLTELLSFLGLANFYRRFVLGFSHIAWTLSQITRGGGKEKFAWGRSQQQAFNYWKQCLCSAPIISLPDLQQPFEIEIDASDYVVGVILTQHGHPVAYHSKTPSYVVCKYHTYDKEMYSIMQACHQWRHYILGKETVIDIDHKPLQFMRTQEKLQNDCHQKWSTYLQQFHLNIKYKIGSTNHIVD
jgi:hypothetical protein